MKKNNSYLADDEIDLGSIIKSLWKEKILILSISIICGLIGYLYAFFQYLCYVTIYLLIMKLIKDILNKDSDEYF
jgi:LPS O-antigen subunit length determinant protein (WzzB/FepE family)